MGYLNEYVDEWCAAIDAGDDKAAALNEICTFVAQGYEVLVHEALRQADEHGVKRELVLSYFEHVMEAGVDYGEGDNRIHF